MKNRFQAVLGAALTVVLLAMSASPLCAAAAAPDATVQALLAAAQRDYASSQAVVVTAQSADGPRASITAYALEAGRWKAVIGPIPAVLGQRGITLHGHEGGQQSPAGIFYLGRAFGTQPRPDGVSLPYTQTTAYDYWVDDATSPDYNRWETWYGNPKSRWKSAERLHIPDYEYAAVIEYNTHPIVPGRGSAMFFHVWPGPDGWTAGCTAVSKDNVLKVLRWLVPTARPVIIQGTPAQLAEVARANGKG